MHKGHLGRIMIVSTIKISKLFIGGKKPKNLMTRTVNICNFMKLSSLTAVNYLRYTDFFPHRVLYYFPVCTISNIDWESSIKFYLRAVALLKKYCFIFWYVFSERLNFI